MIESSYNVWYRAVEIHRGNQTGREAGASSCKDIIINSIMYIKSKIPSIKHAMSQTNKSVKEIVMEVIHSNNKLKPMTQIKQCLKLTNLSRNKTENLKT